MQKMIYEPLFELEKTGINIAYHTKKGRYSPTHWHSAIELIYVLNGTATISIEGKDHKLVAGEFIVVDSNRIHEAQCTRVSMMVVIHYSRASMQNYMTKIDEYRIYCSRQTLKKEKLDKYLEICSLLKRLPPLYVTRPPGYRLQSQAVAMEVLFELVNHFSVSTDPAGLVNDDTVLERLAEITAYIEAHHREKIVLEDIASRFYLSREYFSRFFRQKMGVTFSRYVNQVRLMHIYHDLCSTGEGVMELAEKHGFANYKLFNRMFWEIYGCKPSDVRKK